MIESTLLLAIDPNIPLAAALGHQSSDVLLEEIIENGDFIRIMLDEEEVIIQDYENLVPHLGEVGLGWLKWLLEDQDRRTKKNSTKHLLPIRSLLPNCGCEKTVEPELIGVCTLPGRPARLVVIGDHFSFARDLRHRGVHDAGCLQKISDLLKDNDLPQLQVLPVRTAGRLIGSWVMHRPAYPSTLGELEELLERSHHVENDALDFKQPRI